MNFQPRDGGYSLLSWVRKSSVPPGWMLVKPIGFRVTTPLLSFCSVYDCEGTNAVLAVEAAGTMLKAYAGAKPNNPDANSNEQ